MLAAPYITFAAFAIAAGVVSLVSSRYIRGIQATHLKQLSELHPNKVTRDRRFFYCSLHYDKL